MSPKEHVPKENRPRCGIVYSDSMKESNESKYLAQYLCGQLVNTGYANVYMVGLTPDGVPSSVQSGSTKRISYMPCYCSSRKKIDVPESDVIHSHFDVIGKCHVVIITVNSQDVKMCKAKLLTVLDEKRQNKDSSVTIFVMSRGVKNSMDIKSVFSGRKDIAVIDAAVGFAVVPHPKTGVLVPTVQCPIMIFERLEKAQEAIALGPCNLMECMNLEVYYRKVLTPYTWGVLLWENVHCVNMLTGGTIYDTLWDKKARLILASMIRESLLALKSAACGGRWAPEMPTITQWISPYRFELWLCMPDWIFIAMITLFGMCPPPELQSPMLVDNLEGRTTVNTTQLGELVSTGKRYNVQMPVCSEVFKIIEAMDAQSGPRKSKAEYLDLVATNVATNATAYMRAQEAKNESSTAASKEMAFQNSLAVEVGKKSQRELRSRLFRYGIYCMLVLILYILFVYEHEREEALEQEPHHLDQEIM